MEFHILTLFPSMFQGPLQASILGRASRSGIASFHVYDIRDFAPGRHRVADDAPFGGGPGMVMKPEPVFDAAEAARLAIGRSLGERAASSAPVILMSPQGRTFTQAIARELALHPALVLVCGHYEGVDARVEEALATDSISAGDYVLTGGELPAMVVVDAVVRLLPGALHSADSAVGDSFSGGLLQGLQYTRPAVFRGMPVPSVLLSGDHAAVERWRRRQALLRTWRRRPDLLRQAALTPAERALLEALERLGPRALGLEGV